MLRSIRARVTVALLLTLAVALTLFGATIWYSRKEGPYYNELQRYVASQSELALRIIYAAERRGPVTVVKDSLVGPQVTAELAEGLEVIPDYLLVLDTIGRAVYVSTMARSLPDGDRDDLFAAAQRVTAGPTATLLSLKSDTLFLTARLETDPRTPIARIVAGSSTRTTQATWREVLRTMWRVGPILLLLAGLAAWRIGAAAVAPLDRVTRDLSAITDGRSLHRRLAGADPTGDELARLTATLNEMIGRLEDSFGGLRRFTADASHELKTPLTVLRACVERAMGARRGSTEQMQALEEALHEVTRMADLVNGLLTLARADEGRFDLVRDVVLLDALLRDVAETAVILGEPAGITVSVPQVAALRVDGDAMRLRQLLLNLITNAIKYTPRGGRVELALTGEDGSAIITVSDTGIGIAAADLPFIFDRFYRADRARTRSGGRGGTGLGLAISQYIAQAHGGTLTVTSRLGRGSTFTLVLPGATRHGPSGPRSRADAA